MCVVLHGDDQISFDPDAAALGNTDVFQLNLSSSAEYNRFLVKSLSGSGRLRVFDPDVFLADFGAFGTDAVADALDKPTVFLWWHQSLFPTDLTPSVPRLGSGRARSLSFCAKVRNWAEKARHNLWLNRKAQRRLLQYIWSPTAVTPPPSSHLVTKHHIITPGLLGLDLPTPTCPNVHRVGFLHSESDRRLATLPSEWKKWVDGCLYGVIYVNIADENTVESLEFSLADISERFGTCIVWKTSARLDEPQQRVSSPMRTQFVEHLPFSQRLLLSHRSTKLIITQCGQTTVQEAIDTETAILCVSNGDANRDLLQRVEEGMLGDVVDAEAESVELTSSILYLFNNSRVFEAIRRVKRMGYLLGGTQHAAEVVELAAQLGRGDRSFVCSARSFTVLQLLGILVVSFGVTAVFLLTTHCLRSSRRNKVKVD